MAVISPAGVVGRIILPTSRAAKVQLLIDRDAAAGAVAERSRAQGVVVGTGTSLRLDHVPGTADIKIGDRVVTSGIEGIYPKGFEIGQIESIDRRSGEFSAVIIRPAVEFSSLEAVLVVLTPPSIEAGVGYRGWCRFRRRGPVRTAGVLIAIALALALQTTLAPFVVGGTTAIDLVLVCRGLHRADERAGERHAGGKRGWADSGPALDRRARDRRAGEVDRRIRVGAIGSSSSSPRRCRGW
jgi:hypothetical protein